MQQRNENVPIWEDYTSVWTWMGTTFGDNPGEGVEDMVQWLRNEVGVRVQYLEQITTGPSVDEDGKEVPGTGGRIDQLIAVHEEDYLQWMIFALQMRETGIAPLELIVRKHREGEVRAFGSVWPERLADYVDNPVYVPKLRVVDGIQTGEVGHA